MNSSVCLERQTQSVKIMSGITPSSFVCLYVASKDIGLQLLSIMYYTQSFPLCVTMILTLNTPDFVRDDDIDIKYSRLCA